MLNQKQTDYMLDKFYELYDEDDVAENPILAVEAIGYLRAIKEATDIEKYKETIGFVVGGLFAATAIKLQGLVKGDYNDKL